MKKLGLTLLAAASLSLAATASLPAQTILNGSFENPALPAGNFAAGSGANWTATGSAYVFTNGFGDGTTPYGTQYEALYPAATDAQMVSGLTLNTIYTLSLVASALSPPTQLTIAISGGATASQSFALPQRSNVGNTPIPFMAYSLDFTPTTSTPVTVTLSDSGANYVLLMDNVQLTAAAAPEPSTWALLGLGVAGLGVVTLRRRSSAAARA